MRFPLRQSSAALAAACLWLVGAAPVAAGAPARGGAHVVIVTVDGLRPDAISETNTPSLARLRREGASSGAARVHDPTLTLPSHFSMATGQSPARHRVLTNTTLEREPDNATLFTVAHDAGLHTGLYVGKTKLKALAPRGSADVAWGPGIGGAGEEAGPGAAVAARFAADFARERFALAWVHLRDADDAGHDKGWMTPEYHAALREVDRALAVVLRAIADSGLPVTVILTADHGGSGRHHNTDPPLDSRVPWICHGPGSRAGAAIATVSVMDTGPTAAALLGLRLPKAEGRVVKECLPGRG